MGATERSASYRSAAGEPGGVSPRRTPSSGRKGPEADAIRLAWWASCVATHAPTSHIRAILAYSSSKR